MASPRAKSEELPSTAWCWSVTKGVLEGSIFRPVVLNTFLNDTDTGTESILEKFSEWCSFIFWREGVQHALSALKDNWILGNSALLSLRSQLEYHVQLWSPHQKKDMDLLKQVQRRDTKMIRVLEDFTAERVGLFQPRQLKAPGRTPSSLLVYRDGL